MKTLSFFLTIVFVSLFLTGCQQETIIEEVTNGVTELQPEFMGKKEQQRPFTARFISMPQGVLPSTCGPAPSVAVTQTGTGNATHMGKISAFLSSCVTFTTTPPSPVSASIVLTAANGDELHMSGPGTLGSSFTVNGGTGRFATASGVVTGTYVILQRDPVTNNPTKIANALSGYITY